jgi:hypothetical protein
MIESIKPVVDRIQVAKEQIQVKEKDHSSETNESILYCGACQTYSSNPQPVIDKRKRKYRPL